MYACVYVNYQMICYLHQAAGTNLDLLVKQITEFKPKLVCIQKGEMIDELKSKLSSSGF